jgi:spore coat protein U-like protein
MKNLLKAVVLATAMALPMAAAAATTAPQPFNVTVNLTGACTIAAVGSFTQAVTAGVAFPGATPTQTVAVTCTNNMGYQLEIDTTTANVAGTAAGIPYTLSFPSYVGQTGTGAAQNHTLTATFPAGTYAGDCAAPATPIAGGCTQTNAHQITVTF